MNNPYDITINDIIKFILKWKKEFLYGTLAIFMILSVVGVSKIILTGTKDKSDLPPVVDNDTDDDSDQKDESNASKDQEEDKKDEPKHTVTTTKEVVVDEKISFNTIKTADTSKPEVAGKNGNKRITYSVTYEDGKEVSRKVIKEEITVKAVDEIIHTSSGKPDQTPTPKPDNPSKPQEPITPPETETETEDNPINPGDEKPVNPDDDNNSSGSEDTDDIGADNSGEDNTGNSDTKPDTDDSDDNTE